MRRAVTIAAVVLSSAGLVALGAGCGGGESAGVTPADATTIENNAPQTDSQGKTIPAPGADSGSSGGGDATAGGADAGAAAGGAAGGGAAGDAAAGKVAFEANCQGCHPAGGTQAGAGPQLSASKKDAAQVKMQIMNGKGAMPGGLVSGTDLDNVVAYVMSIEQ
ncbi:MAG: c-type cytochrome [Actinomycetota bacterium]